MHRDRRLRRPPLNGRSPRACGSSGGGGRGAWHESSSCPCSGACEGRAGQAEGERDTAVQRLGLAPGPPRAPGYSASCSSRAPLTSPRSTAKPTMSITSLRPPLPHPVRVFGEPAGLDVGRDRSATRGRSADQWPASRYHGRGNAHRARGTMRVGGDFLFQARVEVQVGESFDAGVLVVWLDETTWAKLCFEYSPQREPMVVSVVTRGTSDDCNSVVVRRPVRLVAHRPNRRGNRLSPLSRRRAVGVRAPLPAFCSRGAHVGFAASHLACAAPRRSRAVRLGTWDAQTLRDGT